MAVYRVQGPDGAVYRIEGPDDATEAQIAQFAEQQFAPQNQQAGFIDSMRETATSLRAAPAAVDFAQGAPGGRSALLEQQMSQHAKTSFSDIQNLADGWNWAKQTAGSSAGYLVAPGAAGVAATLMKGPAAGKAVGLGVLGAQYLTENLGRQAAEQQQDIDQGIAPQRTSVGKAGIAAAAQTGLDVVGFKFFAPVFKSFPMVGKLFGTEGDEAAQEVAENIVKASEAGTLKRRNGLVKGVVSGTAFEMPQEIAQQALERYQAGQSLSDADARAEYMEAAAGAVLLGSTLGGARGAINTHQQKRRAAEIVKLRKQEAVNAKDAQKAELAKQQDAAIAAASRVPLETNIPMGNLGASSIPATAVAGTSPATAKKKQSRAITELALSPEQIQTKHWVGTTEMTTQQILDAAKTERGNLSVKKLMALGLTHNARTGVSQKKALLDELVKQGIVTKAHTTKHDEFWQLAKRRVKGANEEATTDVPPFEQKPSAPQGEIDGQAPTPVTAATDAAAGATGDVDAGATGTSDVLPVPQPAAADAATVETGASGVGVDQQPADAPAAGTEDSAPALTAPILTALNRVEALRSKVPDHMLGELASMQDFLESGQATAVPPDIQQKLSAYEDLTATKNEARSTDRTSPELTAAVQSGKIINVLEYLSTQSKTPLFKELASMILGNREVNADGTERRVRGKPVYVGGVEEDVAPVTEGEFDPAPKLKMDKNSPYLSAKHFKNAKDLTKTINSLSTRKGGNPNFNVEGAAKYNKAAIDRLKKLGRVAEYDAKTNTFNFAAEGVNERIVMHEVLHAFTVKILRQYIADPTQLTQEQLDGAKQIERIMQASKRELSKQFPDAYENVYEFAAHAMTEPDLQRQLGAMKVKGLAQYTKSTNFIKKAADNWTRFVEAVMKMLGIKDSNAPGNLMVEMSEAIKDVLSLPGKVEGVGALAARRQQGTRKREEPYVPNTFDENVKNVKHNNLGIEKEVGLKRAGKFLLGSEGYEWVVRKFQNDRRPLKKLEDDMIMAGRQISEGDQANDLYAAISLSTGRAKYFLNTRLLKPMNAVHRAIEAYADASGVDIATALAKLQLYSMAVHEGERRKTKFLNNVPLDNSTTLTAQQAGFDPKFVPSGYPSTPAGFREFIQRDLATNTDAVSNGKADHYRQVLEGLVAKYKTNINASTTALRSAAKMSTEINDRAYDVVGEYSQAEFEEYRQRLENDHKAEYTAVMDALKTVQEESIKLDKEANYWSQPTDNFKAFYGWKDYVPFKGKPVSDGDERYDFASKRMNGDLIESANSFEGRESDPDNPILRTLMDATKSATRAGRHGTSLRIKNLLSEKILAGKPNPIKTFSFYERYNGQMDDPTLKGPNIVLHYTPDGNVEVLELSSRTREHKDMRDAIRRAYTNPQPLIQAMNRVTSAIGHMHTRYNPAFHPYNFVRDILTNAFMLGAEKDWKTGSQLPGAVASMVMGGGFTKAAKITKLYNEGRYDELETLLKDDAVGQDMLEFLHEGGEVTYISGLALKGQFDDLQRDIGKDKIVKTLDQINKYVDIWTGMFELTSRASTYSLLKSEALARMKKEGKDVTDDAVIAAARREAAEHAKNLMNFEQVGEWGRAAGAAFMFFRPAATGAVRAIDALAPAFQDVEKVIERLPPHLREDPAAVAKFREAHAKKADAAKAMMYGLAGTGFMLYVMALLASDNDEAGRNHVATEDMALWTRNLRLPLGYLGGDGYLQLPWGFGLGSMAAAGAQVAALAFGNQKGADMASNMTNIALDSFIPIPVSRISPIDNPGAWLIDTIVPSPVRPVVEFQMNVDSLGRDIYNDRQNKYGDPYTGGQNLPPLYMWAARMMSDITNGEVAWQPNSINFWVNNYADGLARIAHTMYGTGMLMNGTKGFDPKTDIIGLSSYIGRKGNYDGRKYAAVSDTIEEFRKTLNMYKKRPDQMQEFLKRYPRADEMVDFYDRQANRRLRDLQTHKNVIISTPNGFMLPAGLPLPDGSTTTEPTPYNDKLRKEFLEENKLLQNQVKREIIDTLTRAGLKI